MQHGDPQPTAFTKNGESWTTRAIIPGQNMRMCPHPTATPEHASRLELENYSKRENEENVPPRPMLLLRFVHNKTTKKKTE